MQYFQRMRARELTREYWFDLLIVALAVAAMVEVIATRESAITTLWFGIPAIAILVLPILARRRFPFGGPLAYFVLAAAVSLGLFYVPQFVQILPQVAMVERGLAPGAPADLHAKAEALLKKVTPADTPAVTWTTMPPAKSMTPSWASQPPPHAQCATGA